MKLYRRVQEVYLELTYHTTKFTTTMRTVCGCKAETDKHRYKLQECATLWDSLENKLSTTKRRRYQVEDNIECFSKSIDGLLGNPHGCDAFSSIVSLLELLLTAILELQEIIANTDVWFFYEHDSDEDERHSKKIPLPPLEEGDPTVQNPNPNPNPSTVAGGYTTS